MCSYYLFSNFDMEHGFSQVISNELMKDIRQKVHIAFIASDPNSSTISDRYAKIYMKWFEKIGLDFECYKMIDNRMSKSEMKEIIQSASAIFLMGGKTQVQFQFIKDKELDVELQKYKGCIMGLSAGAINMAKTSICSKDCDHEKTEVYRGINLIDISVEPHFDISNSKLTLAELIPISEQQDIYAMCDEAAIVCRDDTNIFIGEIYLLSKGKVLQVSNK